MHTQMIDFIPIWLWVIITTGLFSIAVELGFHLGKGQHARPEEIRNPQISTILGASLSLLAFFLAFTFNMAGLRYDARKKLVLDEVKAVEKAYLRSQLLPNPYRTEFQDLLRKYIDARAQLQKEDFVTLQQVVIKSEELHALLWSKVGMLSEKTNYSGGTALFIRSLNEVFDLHTERLNVALRNRIPISIFLSLYFIAFISMALMGYQAGLIGRRSPIPSFALVLTFAIVMTLITDLERPRQNLFRVNQQAMVDLNEKVGRTP